MNAAVRTLEPGKYGPFSVEWNARKKIWVVKADTDRALNRFSMGTRQSDGSKVVSSDAAVEARVVKFFKKYISLVEEHQATEWPTLSGLAFDYEDDGFLRITGEALAYYKATGALGAVSISKGTDRHDTPQALIPPTQIDKVVNALIAGQEEAERSMGEITELMQFTEPGPKASVLGADWPYVDCKDAGSEKIISGLMVLLEGHRIEVQPISYGGDYRPRFAVPASDWVPTLRSIKEMTRSLELKLLESPEMARLAARADEAIALFKQNAGEGGFLFERRGPFIIFRIMGGFVRLSGRWRWSIPEDAWAFSLIGLLDDAHEVGPDQANEQLDLILDMAMVTAGLSAARCRDIAAKVDAWVNEDQGINFVFKTPVEREAHILQELPEQPSEIHLEPLNPAPMRSALEGTDHNNQHKRNAPWVAKLLQPLRLFLSRFLGR